MTAASTPDTQAARKMTAEEREGAFQFKALWKKAAIVLAGPLANFIIAIIILSGLFMTYGQNYTPAIVGEFSPNSAAKEAGMKIDDQIVAINGNKVERFKDLLIEIAMNVEEQIEFTVSRDGALHNIMVSPKKGKSKDIFGEEIIKPLIGVRSRAGTFEIKEHGLFSALNAAMVETKDIVERSFQGIVQMSTGKRSIKEMSGPIGIGKYAGQFFELGFISLIGFAAMISINLGLINLFPIPLLDGGHLLFYAYEAIFRRPMSEKVQEYGFRVGLLLLSGLMIFATVNDLTK
jgi:regulator of sigma E protease